MFPFDVAKPDCRSVALAVCENDVDTQGANAIQAIALFQIKSRDQLDFTVDLTIWLQANGAASLTGGTWAVASGSPASPTIVGQAFSAQGKIVAVLQPPNGAKPGDAYWMDVTAEIGATTPLNPGDVAIPARTLTRRVNIVVVAG